MPFFKRNIFEIRISLQKKLMFIVFLAIFLPATVVGCAFYALLSVLNSSHKLSAGEDIMMFLNMDYWMLIVMFIFPLVVILVWIFAIIVTNKIVGPIERITSEIKARLDGTKEGPIILRPGDQLTHLMEQINALLEKKKKL
jgi:hypothetical protein